MSLARNTVPQQDIIRFSIAAYSPIFVPTRPMPSTIDEPIQNSKKMPESSPANLAFDAASGACSLWAFASEVGTSAAFACWPWWAPRHRRCSLHTSGTSFAR